MRIISAVLFAATLAHVPAVAAPGDRIIKSEDDLEFVVPKGSPVRLASRGPYAEFGFRGAFTLTGTFTYGYSPDDPPEEPRARFVFRLDTASARMMPHWPGELAREIGFSNLDAFLAAMIPTAQLVDIQTNHRGIVSRRVSIRADSWHAVLGCGDAYYSARYVKTRTPPRVVRAQPLPDLPDC